MAAAESAGAASYGGATARRRLTVPGVASLARDGAKIAMLTCYDASFAAACERAGVDVLLVGDSLGMVIQGHASTLPVTLDDVVYHTQAVARGCRRPLLISRPMMRMLSSSRLSWKRIACSTHSESAISCSSRSLALVICLP